MARSMTPPQVDNYNLSPLGNGEKPGKKSQNNGGKLDVTVITRDVEAEGNDTSGATEDLSLVYDVPEGGLAGWKTVLGA